MKHQNQQPFPSRPREWFVAGMGFGVLWALATNPAGLGCLVLLLLVGASISVVVLVLVAAEYWWLTVGGAALFVTWLYVRYCETRND